MAQDIPSVTK